MKKIYTICIFICSVCIAEAQTTSASFDIALAAHLQYTLDSIVTANNVQGASCAAFVPGQGNWVGVAGESFPGQPITADMRFNEASQSKGMVATVILRLQEEGILSLDDNLYDWLPSYDYIDSSITIRQLLTHESGLFDYINDGVAFDSIIANPTYAWTPDELLTLFMGPPLFSPGESYDYSNTNYTLAGMIVEVATGLTLAQALHMYIWDVVGMDSTYYSPQEPPIGTAAHNWEYGTDYSSIPADGFNSSAFGCAGVVSTASEMASWYRNLFEGNIISETSIQQMQSYEHIYYYGLGIYGYSYDGFGILSHDGSWIGMNSATLYDTKTKRVISVCINARPDSPYEIIDALYHSLNSFIPAKTNDAAILAINSPSGNNCESSVIPGVIIKNAGSGDLTSAEIHYGIEGGTDNIISWSGSLASGEQEVFTLPAFTPGADGRYTFYASAQEANGDDDGYAANDGITMPFSISEIPVVNAPYFEGFESSTSLPENWLLHQPDHLFNWGVTNLSAKTGNNALVKNNYSDVFIGLDLEIESPVIDLSEILSPELSFEVAYKTYPGLTDTLELLISTDCGQTFESIFYEGGDDLASANSSPIFEASESNYELNTIDLSAFSGQQIILKFDNINGWSNCLYIDDVSVHAGAVAINTITETDGITVYPNPVKESATIQLSEYLENAELIIYDITGKKVKTLHSLLGNKIIVNTEDFSAGSYFFSIMSGPEISANGKFIVQ